MAEPLPKVRDDLGYFEQTKDGRTVILVKDPIRAYFVGFNELQIAMMKLLDGKRSCDEVVTALEDAFETEIPPETVLRFVKVLEEKMFLDVGAYGETSPAACRAVRRLVKRRDLLWWSRPGCRPSEATMLIDEGVRLVDRNDPCRAARLFAAARLIDPTNERARALEACVHEAYFKAHRTVADHMVMIHLFDPDRFLEWIDRSAGRWIFSPWYFAFLGAMALLAGPALLNMTPPKLESIGIVDLVLLRTLIFVPEYFVHEVFGHGLACKHYGGKVNDVGVMLFYGIVPGAYTDVTDVHRFQSPRQRVVVYLAGVLAQLPMLSIWCQLYYYADDRFFLHNAIFLWLVYGPFLMAKNLVPTLVGLDGYYALTHALDRPNLAADARAHVVRSLKRVFFGIRDDATEPAPRDQRIFVAFGIASGAMFLVFSIGVVFWMLMPLAIQYLHGTGVILCLLYAYFAVGRRLFVPVTEVVKFVWRERTRIFTIRRSAVGLAIVVATVGLLAIRWPLLIDGTMTVQPVTRATMFAEEPGIVDAIFVREGERVTKGQVLGRLRDDDLARERAELDQRLVAEEARLAMLRAGTRRETIAIARAMVTKSKVATRFSAAERVRAQKLEGAAVLGAEDAALVGHDATSASDGSRVDVHTLDLFEIGSRPEDVVSAEAQVAELVANRTKLDERIARLTFRSPIDGVVVGPHMEEQIFKGLARGAVFCEVHDLSRVYAEIELPSSEPLSWLAEGQAVALRASGLPHVGASAPIRLVKPASGNESAHVIVETTPIANPGWRSGLTGRARVYGAPRSIAYQLFIVPIAPLIDYKTWFMVWG